MVTRDLIRMHHRPSSGGATMDGDGDADEAQGCDSCSDVDNVEYFFSAELD